MGKQWLYGNAWEEFPLEAGEVWGIPANTEEGLPGGRVSVHDIFDPLPSFMFDADLLFVDPPWNISQVNSFLTKASLSDRHLKDFKSFTSMLFSRICEIDPDTTYIEIGHQNLSLVLTQMENIYPHVQVWDVVYYRKHPSHLIRGTKKERVDYDFTGKDEAQCINIVPTIEDFKIIGDLCMGMGLVGVAAYEAGKPFVGTELNPRRLANLLQRLRQKGAAVTKLRSI